MILDENTTLAFLSADDRSIAMAADSDPLDRISVRDYTRDVEIGAFQAERGVTQNIRFNVVLEVARHAAAATDDVDQVLSYDSITEAIEHILSSERINLLETLAERIAEQVLINPQAQRIFVRIEKLDRIPGTLGIEIVRSQSMDNTRGDAQPNDASKADIVHPIVVFMPNDVLQSNRLADWLDVIAAHQPPAVICLERASSGPPLALVASASRRIELLSIEQNAWVLAGQDKRCVVVDSRTELDWAMKQGQMSVWAPSRIVLDAVDAPKNETPLELARWFAAEFSAQSVLVLEGFEDADGRERIVLTPQDF